MPVLMHCHRIKIHRGPSAVNRPKPCLRLHNRVRFHFPPTGGVSGLEGLAGDPWAVE